MGVLAARVARNDALMTIKTLKAALAGSWRLTNYVREQGNRRIAPFGPDAYGHLLYGHDGRMAATLCRPDRPRLSHPPGLDWSGDNTEWAAAAQSYFAYTGSYRLVVETATGFIVDHDVEAALLPDWVGTTIRRWGRIGGDQLVLTTFDPAQPLNGAAGSTLSWVRWAGATGPS